MLAFPGLKATLSAFAMPTTMSFDNKPSTPPDARGASLSPSKQSFAITEAQKQALIDNLQLEVTERARKLRAQYALQAQGLRTRLEMRVNRIPQALRKTNMQELVDRYAEPARPAPPLSSPLKAKATVAAGAPSPLKPRGVKRHSEASSDKENSQPATDLDNPKKRLKPTPPSTVAASITAANAMANSRATRTVSRQPAATTVLSPKSHNARTIPSSPVKALPRPVSPVKPIVAPAAKQTRPPSRQMKKPAAATIAPPVTAPQQAVPASHARASSASDSSVGTTIVSKPVPTAVARKAVPAPASAAPATTTKRAGLKSAIAGLTGSTRRAAAKKDAAVAAAAAATAVPAGRVLRKRT